jgi:hypothetical protein
MKSSNVGYGSQHTSEKNQQIIQNRVVQDAELVDMTNTNPGKKKDSNSIKVNPSFNLKTLFS